MVSSQPPAECAGHVCECAHMFYVFLVCFILARHSKKTVNINRYEQRRKVEISSRLMLSVSGAVSLCGFFLEKAFHID